MKETSGYANICESPRINYCIFNEEKWIFLAVIQAAIQAAIQTLIWAAIQAAIWAVIEVVVITVY